MSIKRVVFGCTWGAAACILVSANADQSVQLNVATGLWEVTSHPQVSGDLPPEMQERLQSLPPEQRERIEAAIRGAMADAQQEHVFRECMTRERLSRGFATGADTPECKTTLVSNTRTDFEYRKACASEDGGMHTENARFHIHDPHRVSGTIDFSDTRGGRTMSVHNRVEGKWLGADCGDVKDAQRVK